MIDSPTKSVERTSNVILHCLGVRVPDGFATTAEAYRRFIGVTGLAEQISSRLADLDTDDVQELARAGQEIREPHA